MQIPRSTNQDHTRSGSFHIKRPQGLEYNIQKARELGLQPRNIYPSKLTIHSQGKVWAFNKIEDFQVFVKKRPELNRKFDVQHKNQEKPKKGE